MVREGMSVSPRPHDAGNHLVDPLGFDRTFLHGDADRALELVAVEILALAGGFHHHQVAQLHPLIGGEAPAAGRAEAPAPDGHVILCRTAVLHLRIDIAAKWAAHRDPSPNFPPDMGSYAPFVTRL
jgi:hypothetical protein